MQLTTKEYTLLAFLAFSSPAIASMVNGAPLPLDARNDINRLQPMQMEARAPEPKGSGGGLLGALAPVAGNLISEIFDRDVTDEEPTNGETGTPQKVTPGSEDHPAKKKPGKKISSEKIASEKALGGQQGAPDGQPQVDAEIQTGSPQGEKKDKSAPHKKVDQNHQKHRPAEDSTTQAETGDEVEKSGMAAGDELQEGTPSSNTKTGSGHQGNQGSHVVERAPASSGKSSSGGGGGLLGLAEKIIPIAADFL